MGYCDSCLSAGSVNAYGYCEICGAKHESAKQSLSPVIDLNAALESASITDAA